MSSEIQFTRACLTVPVWPLLCATQLFPGRAGEMCERSRQSGSALHQTCEFLLYEDFNFCFAPRFPFEWRFFIIWCFKALVCCHADVFSFVSSFLENEKKTEKEKACNQSQGQSIETQLCVEITLIRSQNFSEFSYFCWFTLNL